MKNQPTSRQQTGAGIDLNFDDISVDRPTFKEAADAALSGGRRTQMKTVSLQVRPEIRTALRKLHADTGIGIQQFVEQILSEALEGKGYPCR